MSGKLIDLARDAVERHDMLRPGQVVLAMVSGGADSVAMLHLLTSGELVPDLKVYVLHVDHMLRGDASEADADFVSGLCERLGVPCRVVRYDVGAYAEENGLNLEDAGRRVRYRFADEELDARCREAGVSPALGAVCVAHTLDDQIDTFLMRLATGAGASGLSAIPPVRGRIVRPLILARRGHVLALLTTLGEEWREDLTNYDRSRLRARVRHELKPIFEAINPRFDEAVARSVSVLADEDRLLDEMAEAFSRDFVRNEGEAVAFEGALMTTLSRPMARRTVRKALLGTFPESSRLEYDHIEALVDGMAEEGFARDLPFGLRAWSEYGRLLVSRRGGDAPPVAPSLLEMPGETDLGAAGVIRAGRVDPKDVSDDAFSATIDAALVKGPLTVDGPRHGDRMRPLGMRGRKKLQDLLVDAKIPRRLRGQVPVVRDGDDIVWVAGVRLCEDYKVGPGTTAAYMLTWMAPGDGGKEE